MVLREHLRSVRTRKTSFDGVADYIKYYLLRTFVIFVFIASHIYDYTTYPVYWMIYHPWLVRRYQRSNHAKIEKKSDCLIFDSLDRPCSIAIEINENNLTTMDKVFDYAVSRYKDKDCLGTREILSDDEEIQPNGKIFHKYDLGDYCWSTYEQFQQKAINISRGLHSIGLKPKENVAILAETRAEWLISAYACFRDNLPIVTIYTNLGNQGIIHALTETEATCVFCSHETLPKLNQVASECSKFLKYVIVMRSPLHPTFDATQIEKQNIKSYSFEDILDLGGKFEKNIEEGSTKPSAHDTAIIMYTSGSTGKPKGVMLTHNNLIAAMTAQLNRLDSMLSSNETYIAYLPLAHVLELLVEIGCMVKCVRVGYSSPLTLIDTSPKIKKGNKGDATLLQPTLMASVPLILERIYKNIVENIRKQGWVIEELFHYFVNYKIKWHDRGFDTPLLNKTLFRKIRYTIGGRVRKIISGGAPLSPDTHSLTRACLCAPVMQGYALTETTAAATLTSPKDSKTGRVGAPFLDVRMKLVNWEEGNYLISDEPNPRGEIHIGGNNVAIGYYKNPEKTEEEFYNEDGVRWFRTGDIGEIESDGVLKIIDRKKDLVKLQGGEYISYGKVESILKTHELVESICVYANPTKDFAVAILVPNLKALQGLAENVQVNLNMTDVELCKNEKVLEKLIATLSIYGLKNGLEKFETPKKYALVLDEWTPDSGLVTAAFKIRRLFITKRYEKEIDYLYQ